MSKSSQDNFDKLELWGSQLLLLILALMSLIFLFDNSKVNWFSPEYVAIDEISYLEDEIGALPFEGLLNKSNSDLWTPLKSSKVSMGFKSSTIWFRLSLENNREMKLVETLMVSNLQLSDVTFYAPLGPLSPSQDGTPELIRYDEQKFNLSGYSTLLPQYPQIEIPFLEHQRLTVYVKVTSQYYSMIVPFKVLSQESQSSLNDRDLLIKGGYFGCMFAMFIFNLLVYLSTRDLSYLYYVGYLAAASYMALIELDLPQGYIFKEEIDSFRAYIFSGSLSIIMVIAFSKAYLSLKEHLPSISKWLSQLEITLIALALLGLIYPSYNIVYIILAILVPVAILLFYAGVKDWLLGSQTAKYYILAWSTLFISSVIYAFLQLGYVDSGPISEHLIQISNVIQALLLSLGLAYRINKLSSDEQRTRLEALHERSSRLKEKLFHKEVMKSRSLFFASMSHEFRTPLTAILGYSQIAQDQEATQKVNIGYAKIIESSAQHMLQLINDVLDLSKIEAQKLDIEIVETDTAEICSSIMGIVKILAERNNTKFHINITGKVPRIVFTDPTRLKQALLNLCSNAVKFTTKGTVDLNLSYDESNKLLTLDVADTGIGLKPDQMEKLFGAFSQADSSTTRKFGGTGLGLHLSKLISKHLGGDITVESEHGVGSTFSLTIKNKSDMDTEWLDQMAIEKLLNQNQSDIEPATGMVRGHSSCGENKSQEHKSLKVLVVDDNQVNLKLFSQLVKKSGSVCVTARDGVEAISLILQGDYDVVLMDIEMPILDGIETVKLLREKEISTQIYALTGHVDSESIKHFLQSGFNGHMAKPINRGELKNILDHIQAEIS